MRLYDNDEKVAPLFHCFYFCFCFNNAFLTFFRLRFKMETSTVAVAQHDKQLDKTKLMHTINKIINIINKIIQIHNSHACYMKLTYKNIWIAGSAALYMYECTRGNDPVWAPSDFDIFIVGNVNFTAIKSTFESVLNTEKVITFVKFFHNSMEIRLVDYAIKSLARQKLSLINTSYYSNIVHVLQDFDISCCGVGFNATKDFIFANTAAKHDIINHQFHITYGNAVTSPRIQKYTKRAYKNCGKASYFTNVPRFFSYDPHSRKYLTAIFKQCTSIIWIYSSHMTFKDLCNQIKYRFNVCVSSNGPYYVFPFPKNFPKSSKIEAYLETNDCCIKNNVVHILSITEIQKHNERRQKYCS